EYSHAIVAIALTALIGLAINPFSAIWKTSNGVTAGGPPKADYEDPVYRMDRTYQNLTEMMGIFAGVTAAAILAGASPFWVNLLASLFFVSRVAVAFVHIKGIGKPVQGPRTFIFVFGWACCVVLALMAIWAAF
ncbi:MAG: MAPEG family protein, partial [Boseongicola sp.]